MAAVRLKKVSFCFIIQSPQSVQDGLDKHTVVGMRVKHFLQCSLG